MTRIRAGFSIITILLAVAALSAAAFAGGCGEKPLTLKQGELSVGSPTDVIPFEAMEGGKPVGFDVELATEVAKRLGLELKFVPTAWNDLIPNLKAGKFDVIVAAMTITYDRQKVIDFSDPYFATNQSIVVNAGSPIKSGNDLAGKVVGVLNESTPQYAAENIKVIKSISKYDTVAQVYDALEKGQVDAMIMDLSIASYRSKADGKTEVVAEIETDEEYGIAVKKGNTPLLGKITETLDEMETDGTLEKINNKWFGAKS